MHIRFFYQAPTAGNHEVGIVGDFTQWKIQSLQSVGDVYLITYDLKPGSYRYKYVVDGLWMPDPSHNLREPDPFGGENSLLFVSQSQALSSWADAMRAAQKHGAHKYLAVHRIAAERLELRVHWPAHLAQSISLCIDDRETELVPVGKSSQDQLWHVIIELPQPASIFLLIRYQQQELYLGASTASSAALQLEPYILQAQDYPLFEIPAWVQDGVIYQIFMDRFCNGKPKLNQDFTEDYYADSRTPPPPGQYLPANREYFHFIDDWYDTAGLVQSPYLPAGKPDWWCFYGGDLAGVLQKLDYLQELGVNIIYFNPLWEAKSVHKYDAADFRKLDPHFGSTRELQELVADAHQRGFKVILDVAFNHSGESFWAFRDCVEKGEASPYWLWYDWFKWPLPKPLPPDFKPTDYYQCWWGIKDMPDLNFDFARRHPYENYIRDIGNADVNEELVNYILDSAEWWLCKIGMDGFRLDVPDEVPYWFWELFRSRVKELKPDAWLVGEIWNNASTWVSPKYFDSVMNYAYFNSPVLELLIHRIIPRAEFESRIEQGLAAYPVHAARAMMNLLGSHDTQRVMQLAQADFRMVKQAVFFQMTFIGTPQIYYGDEIAMLGGKDPDNRRPFNWQWELSSPAREMHAFYTAAISLRQSQSLFVEGEFAFLEAPAELLLYHRFDASHSLICAINLSAHEQVLNKTPGKIIFTEGKFQKSSKGYVLSAYAMAVFHST